MTFVNPGRMTVANPVNRYPPLWPSSNATLRPLPNAALWPIPNGGAGVVTPPFAYYGGLFADRQSRFYLRGLRRGGYYFDDTPLLVLWADDGYADLADTWLA